MSEFQPHDWLEEWLTHRLEVSQRPVTILSEEEIREATGWIADPESSAASLLLHTITSHSGEQMTALGVANLLVGGYNTVAQSEQIPNSTKWSLYATIDLYARHIIKDDEVADLVRQKIIEAKRLASQKD